MDRCSHFYKFIGLVKDEKRPKVHWGVFILTVGLFLWFVLAGLSMWSDYFSQYPHLNGWLDAGSQLDTDLPLIENLIAKRADIARESSGAGGQYFSPSLLMLIPGVLSALLIALFIWLSRKVKSRSGSLYSMAFICLALSVALCLISFKSVMIPAFESDRIYYNTTGRTANNQAQARFPFIVEFVIENKADLEEFKEMLETRGVLNVFISAKSLEALKLANLTEEFFKYVRDQKQSGVGIKIFADLEMEYGPIAFPGQMALAATRSLNAIYALTYEQARKLKQYQVDYVLGPALNRHISLPDAAASKTFGQDFSIIKPASLAMVLATQDAGITCIPKYFPNPPHSDLSVEAAPFTYLDNHRAVHIPAFITDATSLAYSNSRHQNWLTRAKNDLSLSTVFVADDLMSLLYQKTAYPKSVNKDSTFNLWQTPKENRNLLNALTNSQPTPTLRNNVSEVLGIAAHTAVSGGNALVLVKGQKPSSVNRMAASFARLRDETGYVEDMAAFYNMEPPNHLNFKLGDMAGSQIMPFIKLSSGRRYDNETLSSLLSGDKAFYFSSCAEKDEIASANWSFKNRDGYPIGLHNIYSETYAKRIVNKKVRGQIITEDLRAWLPNNSNISHYVFILSHQWQAEPLAVLADYLKRHKKLDRLLIFVAESPDFLFHLAQGNRALDVPGLLRDANVFCIFTNNASVKNMMNNKLKDFGLLRNTPVDLPGYFYNNYAESMVSSGGFDKIIAPQSHSQIIGADSLVRTLFYFHIALTVATCCFFLAGFLWNALFVLKDKKRVTACLDPLVDLRRDKFM